MLYIGSGSEAVMLAKSFEVLGLCEHDEYIFG